MKKYSFYIAGGDLRSKYLKEALKRNGMEVNAAFLNEQENDLLPLKNADVLILPLPCCDKEGYLKAPLSTEKIKPEELLKSMSTGSVLMGGLIPEKIKETASSLGIDCYDYYEREEFAVRNAALTAEAAAAITMDMLSESLSGVPVLVLGYGRIGKLLSSILKALDVKVTVAARRYSDLAWIRSEGITPLEFRLVDEKISKFKVVFNTVPTAVLGKERLMLMDKGSIIIDLASEPGGTDFEAAKEFGITAKKALGLPGKFAPKTAGEIVFDTVLNILTERENEHGE